MRNKRGPCVHCGERSGFAGRGLCKKCHDDPSILEAHRKKKPASIDEEFADDDVDEETLDRIIAEQRETMPGPEPSSPTFHWRLPVAKTKTGRRIKTIAPD